MKNVLSIFFDFLIWLQVAVSFYFICNEIIILQIMRIPQEITVAVILIAIFGYFVNKLNPEKITKYKTDIVKYISIAAGIIVVIGLVYLFSVLHWMAISSLSIYSYFFKLDTLVKKLILFFSTIELLPFEIIILLIKNFIITFIYLIGVIIDITAIYFISKFVDSCDNISQG